MRERIYNTDAPKFKTGVGKTNSLIGALTNKDSFTENGMVAHSTTSDAVLDLFFLSGASRNLSEKEILNLWVKAVNENATLAYRALFYAGDVRGGQGERNFFRTAFKYAYENDYKSVEGLLKFVLEFRRADDLIFLMANSIKKNDGKKLSKNDISLKWNDDTIWNIIVSELKNKNGLVAKWLPRSGEVFATLCSKMNKGARDMRKLLVKLTAEANTVEPLMCSNSWSKINFAKVSSKAFNIYKKAFARRDSIRFTNFIENVNAGKEKVNVGVLYPSDIIGSVDDVNYLSSLEKETILAQWNSLPNFIDKETNILPVVDVSGSMGKGKGSPYSVSVGLGLYVSERNKGIFKDAFITFSEKPRLQYLKGNIIERISQFNRGFAENTNLVAVFDLILSTAVRNKISEAEMPKTIVIISDMQFDESMGDTATEAIKRRYIEAGYALPKVVFWNVNGTVGTNPARADERNVNLISGYSPNIMKTVLNTLSKTPMDLMLATLNSERYRKISV